MIIRLLGPLELTGPNGAVPLGSAGQRTLVARLAVFAGSFDLAAAESVCSDDTLTADFMFDAVDGWSTSPCCCGKNTPVWRAIGCGRPCDVAGRG